MQNTFAAAQEVTSLYIHVPFCLSKCHYCDFYSEIASDSKFEAWHRAILAELKLNYLSSQAGNFKNGPLQTIYYGGGTPSLVPPSFFAEQLASIDDLFGIAQDAEITLEANPGVAAPLAAYRKAGFNRISFGLQSASDRLIQIVGRRTKTDAFINDVIAAEKAGFSRICADLMIGLPGQKLQDVDETLDLIVSLPIGHVSYYSLTLAEGTIFWKRYADNPQLLPAEELERAMYDLTMRRLSEEGIFPYEISNAARRGEESRHNLVYWHADSYMALGPSAHSYLGSVRYGNPASLDEWCQRVYEQDSAGAQPASPRTETFLQGTVEEIVDEAAARAETMILGLRLLQGVKFENFRRRHDADLRQLYCQQITGLKERGLIELNDTAIRLSRLGLDLANQVFLEFI